MSACHPSIGVRTYGVVSRTDGPRRRGCTDNVSTKVRVSCPHVRGNGKRQTVCPFSVEPVFYAYLLHEIARELGARLED